VQKHKKNAKEHKVAMKDQIIGDHI